MFCAQTNISYLCSDVCDFILEYLWRSFIEISTAHGVIKMESRTKRARSANFSNDEKILLLNLISNYKHIIENKKTDHVSSEEKNVAWNKIATEFNASAPNNTYRGVETLKKFYDNKKRK